MFVKKGEEPIELENLCAVYGWEGSDTCRGTALNKWLRLDCINSEHHQLGYIPQAGEFKNADMSYKLNEVSHACLETDHTMADNNLQCNLVNQLGNIPQAGEHKWIGKADKLEEIPQAWSVEKRTVVDVMQSASHISQQNICNELTQRAYGVKDNDVQLVHYVRRSGKHNVYGARVLLHSTFNITLMQQLATSTADREVVQFLMFGWPLNHIGTPTTNTFVNHTSATQYPSEVTRHIQKERSYGTLMGPFHEPSFSQNTAISPMSTRPKKDTEQRRIIMDLSWPRNGLSVNDGIPDDTYLDLPMNLIYPTIDLLCKKLFKIGPKAMGYKRDLDRAFKQIGISPNDWPLLGLIWQGLIYYDKTAVMGGRSCPYMCQRLSSFVRHIMLDLSYNLFNYVDDFMGIEEMQKIWHSYHTLGNLLRDLGIKESVKKAVAPTHIIEFLGVLFDMLRMTISITPQRMEEILAELQTWLQLEYYYIKKLQRLIGKLQFITNCVRPGRVMLMRLRQELRCARPGRNEVSE